VAFIAHTADLGGGAGRHLLELVTTLVDSALAEPLVVVPGEGEFAAAVRDAGVPVARAEYGWWCSSRLREQPRTLTLAAKQALHCGRRIGPWATSVARAVRDFSPDVVASNTCVSPAGAIAAARMRVPHLWLANEHGRDDFGLTFYLGFGPSMRLLGLSSAVVVSISHALGRALGRYVPSQKIEVLHTASLTPVGTALTPAAIGGPLRLLMLGRGVPAKGGEDAIHAVRLARAHGTDARLRFVGVAHPDDQARLRALVDDTEVRDAVEVVGYVDDALAEIDEAHACLTCSRVEAFGRVTIEYLRRGRPVIGTRAGGTPEIIDDGVTGFLYEPGDAKALAQKIELLAGSNETLTRMSSAALERNAHRFLPSEHVERFSRVVERARRDGPALRWRVGRSGAAPTPGRRLPGDEPGAEAGPASSRRE
jgi:glycosyltransferase involved in cell wall biosynthesis